MKKIVSIFAALLAFAVILFAPLAASAQENNSAEWIRVQSDDGEFSIEVPMNYHFMVDKTGFSTASSSNNYKLEDMKMLNAYQDKTLISFESYKAKKGALEAVRDTENNRGKFSEIKLDGVSIKQVIEKTDEFYLVKQYFNSKNRIYILIAASRKEESPAIKRFLNSLIFKPQDKSDTAINRIANSISFSNLKISQIEIDKSPEPVKKSNITAIAPPPTVDPNVLPIMILSKPRASYTDAARMNGEKGTVQVRLAFSQEGYISKAGFLKTLNFGLTRQAFFAALRIKFLPTEKDGKPETVTKLVEYSFDIY